MNLEPSVTHWMPAVLLVLMAGCGGAQPGAAPVGAPASGAASEVPTAAPASDDPPVTTEQAGGPVVAAGHSNKQPAGGSASASAPAADPYADLPHLPAADSGRHQLEAGDVRDTVQAYRPHLRKTCWEPRVNASAGGPATTRVAVEIEVSADGQVKAAKAVGGKGYDGLADCVQAHVRRWQFSRAKQQSSLMFPIIFDRGEATYVQVK